MNGAWDGVSLEDKKIVKQGMLELLGQLQKAVEEDGIDGIVVLTTRGRGRHKTCIAAHVSTACIIGMLFSAAMDWKQEADAQNIVRGLRVGMQKEQEKEDLKEQGH